MVWKPLIQTLILLVIKYVVQSLTLPFLFFCAINLCVCVCHAALSGFCRVPFLTSSWWVPWLDVCQNECLCVCGGKLVKKCTSLLLVCFATRFFSAQQQIFNKGKFSKYFWNNCAKFVFPVSDNDSISRRKDAGTTEVVRGRCHRFVLRCFCWKKTLIDSCFLSELLTSGQRVDFDLMKDKKAAAPSDRVAQGCPNLRKLYKSQKYVPLDLHFQKTRAMKKSQREATRFTQKRIRNSPLGSILNPGNLLSN